MLRLYKKDEQGKLDYAEYWIYEGKATVHYGKVGEIGQVEEIEDDFNTEEEKAMFREFFIKKFSSQGFEEIDEDAKYFVVIQYPLKSFSGTKRDRWLKDKVTSILDEELGWKGLGFVDGFDIGVMLNKDRDKFALNIFCIVVDEEIAIDTIKNVLKKNKCDYEKIKIATRSFCDDDYTLKYSSNSNDMEFYL